MNRSTVPMLLTLSPQDTLHLPWSVLLFACLICRWSPHCTQRPAGGLFQAPSKHGTEAQVCVGLCLTFFGHSISSAITSSWGVGGNFQVVDCSVLYMQPPSALIIMLKHSLGKASSIRNSNVTSREMSTIKLSMKKNWKSCWIVKLPFQLL